MFETDDVFIPARTLLHWTLYRHFSFWRTLLVAYRRLFVRIETPMVSTVVHGPMLNLEPREKIYHRSPPLEPILKSDIVRTTLLAKVFLNFCVINERRGHRPIHNDLKT